MNASFFSSFFGCFCVSSTTRTIESDTTSHSIVTQYSNILSPRNKNLIDEGNISKFYTNKNFNQRRKIGRKARNFLKLQS